MQTNEYPAGTGREQASQDRTPALHRLPLLGWLFKRDEISDESRELLIFITPRILKGCDAMKTALLAIVLLAWDTCGDMVRQGTASSYLIITELEGASGAKPEDFGGDFGSDVVTLDMAKAYFEGLAEPMRKAG